MNLARGAFLLLMITSLTNALAATNNITIPVELSQNAFDFVTKGKFDDTVVSRQQIKSMNREFEEQYYYQWSEQATQQDFYYVPGEQSTKNSVLQLEWETIEYYQDRVGYGRNYIPHSSDWVSDIAENMDLANFPNVSCEESCLGITVDNVLVRSLPTQEEFYNDFTTPGEGYPFDYIQLSNLRIGAPIMLIQTTKDKQWTLIKSQGTMGWVPTVQVAKTDREFRNKWQRSQFVTPTVRKQTVTLKDTDTSLTIESGTILPIKGSKVRVPSKKRDGYAKLAKVEKQPFAVASWPLKPTYENFAKQVSSLTTMPYGWGGKDYNDDCSGLLVRMFSAFGVWLPRASYWQANYSGARYSLYETSQEERKNWLVEQQGPAELIPFMTLVSFGNSEDSTSHIGLYLGTTRYNGEETAVMFNTAWGVGMVNSLTQASGRALISQTLITPIGMGDAFAPGLSLQNWQLSSMWDKVGFNVTLLTEEPAPITARKAMSYSPQATPSIEQYLVWK
ncbi:peptide-binding protein [Vibrio coralliilyticus]|uniref:SH3 domain-containing protein n=1 Tax=Vibrio coralliilyticus TaxID=190893 RepID=UPI0008109763|nr:SH3 domain-containing protein [Vibrio coralliilyticus]ANW26090.1 peptide-binding protein [Vibrio coralliilyticus]